MKENKETKSVILGAKNDLEELDNSVKEHGYFTEKLNKDEEVTGYKFNSDNKELTGKALTADGGFIPIVCESLSLKAWEEFSDDVKSYLLRKLSQWMLQHDISSACRTGNEFPKKDSDLLWIENGVVKFSRTLIAGAASGKRAERIAKAIMEDTIAMMEALDVDELPDAVINNIKKRCASIK